MTIFSESCQAPGPAAEFSRCKERSGQEPPVGRSGEKGGRSEDAGLVLVRYVAQTGCTTTRIRLLEQRDLSYWAPDRGRRRCQFTTASPVFFLSVIYTPKGWGGQCLWTRHLPSRCSLPGGTGCRSKALQLGLERR